MEEGKEFACFLIVSFIRGSIQVLWCMRSIRTAFKVEACILEEALLVQGELTEVHQSILSSLLTNCVSLFFFFARVTVYPHLPLLRQPLIMSRMFNTTSCGDIFSPKASSEVDNRTFLYKGKGDKK